MEKIVHEAVKSNPNDTATKGLCMWHVSSGSMEIMYCHHCEAFVWWCLHDTSSD